MASEVHIGGIGIKAFLSIYILGILIVFMVYMFYFHDKNNFY